MVIRMNNFESFDDFFPNIQRDVDNVLNRIPSIEDESNYVYYDDKGEYATEHNFLNCTLSTQYYYIDIFANKIEVECWDVIDFANISTENFKNLSEEEFFMQSTISDFSLFDNNPKLLRDLITISLMIRSHKDLA